MTLLPVSHASKLECRAQQWLVEGLWVQQGVGIIGGEPKCCKSFMALTLAVSVASGSACLGRFSVASPGPVLLYPAEDSPDTIRRRLEGICNVQGLTLSKLPILVITASRLQLDSDTDRDRLRATVEKIAPRLLILDPFVRLHSIDENASGEVARILQHLRQLQRTCNMSVALVHHAKKGATRRRPGQALRGSSEFHAWGDSNLYLRRPTPDQLTLTVEHRSAPSLDPLPIQLSGLPDSPHLELREKAAIATRQSPEQLVLDLLSNAAEPMRASVIRRSAQLRNETTSRVIATLLERGIIERNSSGYCLKRTTD